MTNKAFRYIKLVLFMAFAVLNNSCNESKINIAFSANLSGHLEDCGCISGKMGGIARRVALVKAHYGSMENAIHFDSGGFSGDLSLEGKEKTLSILKIYQKIGLNAVNVSSSDIANGLLSVYDENITDMPNLLSSNIKKASGESIFKESLIINCKSGTKIGVIGVTTNNINRNLPNGVVVHDAAQILSNIVPEIRQKVQIIILLAAIPRKELIELTNNIRDIDIILGADGYSITHNVMSVNGNHYCFPGGQGKYLGMITLKINDNSGAQIDSYRLLPLTLDKSEDSIVKEKVDYEKDRIASIIKENSLNNKMLRPSYNNIKYYYCNNCHRKEMNIWKNTRHANLGEDVRGSTILAAKLQGFSKKGENVNCVTCHGYSEDHCIDPLKYRSKILADARRCLNCHINKENKESVSFYENNWEKIKH